LAWKVALTVINSLMTNASAAVTRSADHLPLLMTEDPKSSKRDSSSVVLFLLTGDEGATTKHSGVNRRRDLPKLRESSCFGSRPAAVGLRPANPHTFRPTVYPSSNQIRHLRSTADCPKRHSTSSDTMPVGPGFLSTNGWKGSPKTPELRSHSGRYCMERCGALAGIHDSRSENPDSRFRTRCNNPLRACNIQRVFYRE